MDNQPSRILHLFGTYLPNTENWAYNLIRHIPESNIFIAANQYNENFQDEQFHFYRHSFSALEDRYVQLDKKKPIQLAQKIYYRLFKYPRLLLRGIKRFAKENKIELIHIHFANVAWFYHAIASDLNVPMVISFYGWDYEKLPHLYPEYQDRFKILFAKASAIICEGPHGAKILEKAGCPKEKIKIVRLGVQTNQIPFVKRTKKAAELKLIQLASFTQKKGHIYSVKAFHLALKECPNMHLTLVGGEREDGRQAHIIQYIKKHRLQKKISILSSIDYSTLHSFLADFQVFIQPSCYADDFDCEGGAPIAILDAQATGMPIIATTHCDIPMEVIDDETGLLSPEKDAAGIRESISRFYEMEQVEYDGFAQAARRHVEAEFEVEKNAEQLGRTYKDIIREEIQK